MVTHDVYRTTRVCELAGWPRADKQTARQEAPATHTSWRPWSRTTSRRRALTLNQYSLALQHTWANPTGGASTAHPEEAGMRGSTDVNQEAEVLVSQFGGGTIKLAFSAEGSAGQCKVQIRGKSAAEMTAIEKMRC